MSSKAKSALFWSLSLVVLGVWSCRDAIPFQFRYFSLSRKASWSGFDPSSAGVGTEAKGYNGAVFDGRYLYFVPFARDAGRHGEVLRFDTRAEFSSTEAWLAYDPSSNGVGTEAIGYIGGTFDGRYVYFAPFRHSTAHHGEVLRYDTTKGFTAATSWSTYDPGANGVGVDPDGFQGALYCGSYVYFVPTFNGATPSGEVLRYDPRESFTANTSWKAYDPSANGIGTNPEGFLGAVCDGRFVYFVPNLNAGGSHGEVLRLDTRADFETVGAWTAYDPGANGVGVDPDGYRGAVFDGRYVYFAPLDNGSGNHGEILRFDTRGGFTEADSWSVFDALGASFGGSIGGAFSYPVFDGRYVRFLPSATGLPVGFLEYDTELDFSNENAWRFIDPDDGSIRPDVIAYAGAVFDGRYFYFTPNVDFGGNMSGIIHRFEAKVPYSIPGTIFGGSFY